MKSTDKTGIFAVMKHAVKVLKIILGSKIVPFENDDCDLEDTADNTIESLSRPQRYIILTPPT